VSALPAVALRCATMAIPATRRVARYTAVSRAFGRVSPGQCSGVSLPAGQQRVLDRMESALQACEPRLASMFAIFTRLTRAEAVPRTESLPAGARFARIRRFVAIPLVLGYVALFVFLAVTSPAVHGCGQMAGLHSAAAAQSRSCQPAPGPHR